MIRREANCEGFFRQMKQKSQGILCVFPRIFVIYGGNKTRSFDRDESLEVFFVYYNTFLRCGQTKYRQIVVVAIAAADLLRFLLVRQQHAKG